MEGFVRIEDPSRKAPCFEDVVDKLPLDLIEACPYVCTPSCDSLTAELSKLEFE